MGSEMHLGNFHKALFQIPLVWEPGKWDPPLGKMEEISYSKATRRMGA